MIDPEILQAGLSLLSLGQSMARGEMPDPREASRAASTILVALVPVEDLKADLDEAARRRADAVVELAATAKLGSRP